MALKKAYTKQVLGEVLVFENAYHQINSINGNKNFLEIEVAIFKDDEKIVLLDKNYHTFKPNVSEPSENFIKQGYEVLKTLDEYNGAIDC